MLPHIPSPRGPTVRFVMLPGATGIRLGCFWESHCGQAKLIFCSTLYQIYVHTFLVMDVPIKVIIGLLSYHIQAPKGSTVRFSHGNLKFAPSKIRLILGKIRYDIRRLDANCSGYLSCQEPPLQDKVLISDKHLKGVACANSQRSTNSHALESFI